MANLSLFTFIVFLYVVYIAYTIYSISDYIISNGLTINYSTDMINVEGENTYINKEQPSIKEKYHIFLSSASNSNPPTTSQTPVVSLIPEQGSQPKIVG